MARKLKGKPHTYVKQPIKRPAWPTGRRICDVRLMTKEEMKREGWSYGGVVITLDDGATLFASADDEGNAAGSMFGVDKDGVAVVVRV